MKKYILFAVLIITMILLLFKPTFSQNADEYFNKANSMLVSGDFQQAINFYNLAIKQNPNFSEAYLGLGMAYKELGKYNDAYAATQKAIELKPNYYQAYYNLGLILEKQGKNDEAIKSYEKFLDEVPGAERFTDAKQRIIRLKKKN